ncbi:hypothetical protein M758_1G286100 [Ceratodon purpureus]|nr:hypothetical protein M758_1G286100 [Ceratodon purpureus]
MVRYVDEDSGMRGHWHCLSHPAVGNVGQGFYTYSDLNASVSKKSEIYRRNLVRSLFVRVLDSSIWSDMVILSRLARVCVARGRMMDVSELTGVQEAVVMFRLRLW